MKDNNETNNETNYSSIVPVNGELITDNVILGEYISNNTRNKFITRVYNIVFFQLFITCLILFYDSTSICKAT